MALTFTAETVFEATASVTTSGAMTLGTRVAGDYTLLVCSLNASSGVITAPSGWSAVLASTNATLSTSDVHAIWYKKWVSGDASPTVTCTSGRLAVLPVRVEGADGTTFIEIAATVTQQEVAGNTQEAPTVTSTASTTMCVTFNGRSATNGVFITWTPPGGTSEVGEAGGKSATQTNASASFNTSAITVGVASGTRTGTSSNTVTGGMGCSFVLKEAAGGSSFTQSPADNLGLTDTVALDQGEAPADTEGLTDVASLEQGEAPSEALGLTDVVLVEKTREQLAADNLGPTDTVVLDHGEGVTDTEGLTDAIALVRSQVAADAEGLTDTAALTQGEGLADSLALTDAAQTDLTEPGSVTPADNLGLTDTGVAIAHTLTGTEPVGLTDATVVERGTIQSPADTLGLTDALALAQGEGLADSEALTDVTAQTRGQVSVDSLGLTDSALVQLSGSTVLTPADNLGLTDSTTAARDKAVADAQGLTDQVALILTRDLGDTLTLTDIASLTAVFIRVLADVGGLTDQAEVELIAPVTSGTSSGAQMSIPTSTPGLAEYAGAFAAVGAASSASAGAGSAPTSKGGEMSYPTATGA